MSEERSKAALFDTSDPSDTFRRSGPVPSLLRLITDCRVRSISFTASLKGVNPFASEWYLRRQISYTTEYKGPYTYFGSRLRKTHTFDVVKGRQG